MCVKALVVWNIPFIHVRHLLGLDLVLEQGKWHDRVYARIKVERL